MSTGAGVLTHPSREEVYSPPTYSLSMDALVAWLEVEHAGYRLIRLVESLHDGTTEVWEADVPRTLCYEAVDGGVIVRPPHPIPFGAAVRP